MPGKLKQFIVLTIIVVIAIIICDRWIDRPFALYLNHLLHLNAWAVRRSANIRDVLFEFVWLTTLSFLILYLILKLMKVKNDATQFLLLYIFAIPSAFILRNILKTIFARPHPLYWFKVPDSYYFHWFEKSWYLMGFPSGHMLIFTAVMTLTCGFARYLRWPCILALCLLAALLLITGYHFLSDVIAGAYFGFSWVYFVWLPIGRRYKKWLI